MFFRLTHTVARRSSAATARKLLIQAVNAAAKFDSRLAVGTVKVELQDTGHYAEVRFGGKIPDATAAEFRTHLQSILLARFEPPWIIEPDADTPATAPNEQHPDAKPLPPSIPERPVGSINLSFPSNAFERIFGREAQIRRLVDALSVGRDTAWTKRKHTLLSGPPGCGKTDLMLTVARLLGEEGKAYVWYDATSTTKAGAIEQMMASPVLPPILFVEEIEKTPEGSLRWLLGVMDDRGEIRRTNYRVGNQVKSARLTVIATANDTDLLKKVDSGAVYSRFGNRIHCPPPDRDTLEKILTREVIEVAGNSEWVRKTLEFAYDTLNIRDVREILNVLLCGRDRLLTGQYQQDYIATMPPEDRKAIPKHIA